MKALVLRNDADASLATSHALIDKGFQILSVDTQALAHALIRLDVIDLLVMDERVEGQLTHAIALSAERKNPLLSAILMTDRPAAETDDLFALIPSLYSLLGQDTSPEMIGKLALSAVTAGITPVAVAPGDVADAPPLDAQDVIMPQDAVMPPPQAIPAMPALDPLVLSQSESVELARDGENDLVHAVAAAAPAPADILPADQVASAVAAAQGAPFDHIDKAAAAQVEALFRKPALPQFLQAPPPPAARVG